MQCNSSRYPCRYASGGYIRLIWRSFFSKNLYRRAVGNKEFNVHTKREMTKWVRTAEIHQGQVGRGTARDSIETGGDK